MIKRIATFLFIVAICQISSELHAQKFGVKAGLNLSNVYGTDDGHVYSKDYRVNPGFHIGPIAEFPITKIISFETGLFLSTKGYIADEEVSILDYTSKNRFYYLDIPITAKATCIIGKIKIYGNIGPYVGIGLLGKVRFKASIGSLSDSYEKEVEWGDENDNYRRLDYGLSLGAGVEFKQILMGISYGLGIADISSNTYTKANNRVLGISVGYLF
jgi:hypothetical protein